ncbi:MAG: hypothetical protein ABW116_14920 [Candidatus Sedimenticola sp. 20ELBAFRAG]
MKSDGNITDIRGFLPHFGSEQLIQHCREKQPLGSTNPTELMDNLPVVLRGALDLLLEQGDYHQDISSNKAIAARLLALTVVRLEEQQYHI